MGEERLTCILTTMTKKVINFEEKRECTPRENPGYAYAGRSARNIIWPGSPIGPLAHSIFMT